MSFPKGKLFYISTRICGKTEIFQDFIRLEKSVSVLQKQLLLAANTDRLNPLVPGVKKTKIPNWTKNQRSIV